MHNKDKYPEIWAAKTKAEEALVPLMAKRNENIALLEKAQEKAEAAKAEKRAANDAANSDRDEIIRLNKEVARLANAMGAARL